ncbi:hypothetical protein JCM5296_001277 [Sporobolomyces johnsonii]
MSSSLSSSSSDFRLPWLASNRGPDWIAGEGSVNGSARSTSSSIVRRAAMEGEAELAAEQRHRDFEAQEALHANEVSLKIEMADLESEAGRQVGEGVVPPSGTGDEAHLEVLERKYNALLEEQRQIADLIQAKRSQTGPPPVPPRPSPSAPLVAPVTRDIPSYLSPTPSPAHPPPGYSLSPDASTKKISAPAKWAGIFKHRHREDWIKGAEGYLATQGITSDGWLSRNGTPMAWFLIRSLFSSEAKGGNIVSPERWFDNWVESTPVFAPYQVWSVMRDYWLEVGAADAAYERYRAVKQGGLKVREFAANVDALANDVFDRAISDDDKAYTFWHGLQPQARSWVRNVKNLQGLESYGQKARLTFAQMVRAASTFDEFEIVPSSPARATPIPSPSLSTTSSRRDRGPTSTTSSSPVVPASTSPPSSISDWRQAAATFQADFPEDKKATWFSESDRPASSGLSTDDVQLELARLEHQLRLTNLAVLHILPHPISDDPPSPPEPSSPTPPATSSTSSPTPPASPRTITMASDEDAGASPSLPATRSHTSSISASSMYRDSLQRIGEITAATWPRWEGILPKVVAGFSGVPGAEFYLDGTVPREDYKLDGILAVLTDVTKATTFQQWVKLAEALKMVVATYGGADVEARVETFDTKLGDAPGLWKKLKEWYGETATGAEKVVSLNRLINQRWDGIEAPGIYIARLLALRTRLNAAYRADAERHPDPNDPSTKADLAAAISDSLLRDMFLASIPENYSEIIQASITRTTTLSQATDLVTNLYLQRQSRGEIAEMEAARRVASPSSAAPPPAPTHPAEWRIRSNGKGGRGGHRGGKRGKEPKLPATKYPGYERWRGGTLEDRDRVVHFRVPAGTCFSCFRDGHLARDCPTEDKARARVEELKRDGIVVPVSDAMALHTFDCNPDGDAPDHAALAALRAMFLSPSRPPSPLVADFVTVLDDDLDPTLRVFHVTDELDAASPPPLVPDAAVFRVATNSGEYVLDSGATRHFTTQREHLRSFIKYDQPRPVGGTFGSVGTAIGEGVLVLRLEGGPIALRGVMLVPDLGINLISQTRLMMSGMRFSNTRTRITVTDEAGALIAHFPVAPTIRIEASHVVRSPPSSPSALSLDAPDRDIHTWGPAPVGGLKGDKYAVVLVDGYSRYTWGDTMGSKTQIPSFVIEQLKRVERSVDSRLAAFQSDNGTEFVNSAISSFLRSTGIQHGRTVPYVHGQNGLVERRWRSLFDTTRTLLADSRLPLSFWPYAFRSAVYLYNRSPTIALKNVTPFEAFHGSPPDLSNLRAWGCVAYLHVSPEAASSHHKLAPRAVKARFIGYPENQRGWIFWIPEQRKVVTAWNAVFREEEFEGGDRTEAEDAGFEEWMDRMQGMSDEAD